MQQYRPTNLPLDAIRRCSQDPAFLAAVHAVYEEIDRRIADRQPVCDNRGACCRFEAYDHRLYVTTVELACFLAWAGNDLRAPRTHAYCPYQRDGQCSARAPRPAGCRIFFCDPKAQAWQPDLTEWALQALARVGDSFGLQYAYLEWTEALRLLGGTPTPAAHLVKLTIDTPTQPN